MDQSGHLYKALADEIPEEDKLRLEVFVEKSLDEQLDRKYSIAVDFDGVIHSYVTPWISAEEIPDPPVEGAIAWLREMAGRFRIVIHTTRGKTEEGQAAVRRWLAAHGFESEVEVTAVKPPALVYIDDRAWRFEGSFPSAQEIHQARPWHKSMPEPTGEGHNPSSGSPVLPQEQTK